MTPNFKKVALELIEDLSDKQSSAGCNDFNLAEFVPDLEERKALMKKFYQLNGSPEDYEDDLKNGSEFKYCQDFMLTTLLKDWVKNS
jgi:hypothetical protein